ncbi:5-formyltetrahydrofolate cyclo-ligase [Pedobacter sp. P351]|uniref:5-formyltetrahydrofolate cyclo-ligase n=1 Tax=Pedobacter superstes TaxID=3133441 RepID=UPI0030A26368
MTKKELRSVYLQKRKDLLPDELESLSSAIVARFDTLKLDAIRFVHIYYPITGKHEFNSLLLKEHLSTKFPQLKFILPKSNTEDHSLTNILWEKDTPLSMNQWGITEPEYGEEIDSKLIDAVIVPLLAFDRLGHRLGYGRGFYDRFLSDCRPDVIKAGTSYFEPEEKFEDVNEYDIPLDLCITPNEIWRFTSLI